MKPIAFRIREFKSIKDTGTCQLSGDNITVLAGQNEAGKTAILNALRDFDLGLEAKPATQDYQPDDERPSAVSSVSVLFEADPQELVSELNKENKAIPTEVVSRLQSNPRIWVTRLLEGGRYALDEELTALWQPAKLQVPLNSASEDTYDATTDGEEEREEDEEEAPDEKAPTAKKEMTSKQFAGWLRDYWPTFIYFDSFGDALPRQVNFDHLKSTKPSLTPQQIAAGQSPRTLPPKAPAAVMDFATLAELDIDRVTRLAENDKNLGNYLSSKSASITGDFLTYWKQKADSEESVDIRVRAFRDSEGTLNLAFFVHDASDQYPDQRSKGFLWFLSFYLKLAAAQKRDPGKKRVLLIDEPGSYLHARAQRDVLDLFESRIARNDIVIYSTHSPYLIPPDRLHRLRIVHKGTTAGTRIFDRLTHPVLREKNNADSLLPVIAAIGIDITQSLTLSREKNLLVEGISDLMYLTAWSKFLGHDLPQQFNIFPGTSATSIPTLASLLTGWGFKFLALLDNDEQGKATREKLIRNLLVPTDKILQPKDAKTIEDLLSSDDFRNLLHTMDKSLNLNPNEAPSAAIVRQDLDKVLLARNFSTGVSNGQINLTKKSQERIKYLLDGISQAWQ